MSAKDLELRLRQERAVQRSAELRRALSEQSQVLVAPLAQLDRVKAGLLWLRHHPVYLAVVVAAVVALRPRNVVSKLGRVWAVWCTVGRFLR